ncbi:hypothetical protein GTW78_01005, partial [Streptomyces sp. SID4948]
MAASARALADRFADNGVWDLPAERRALLSGEVEMRAAMDALVRAAREQVDLLLVYLGCHGKRFYADPGLKLALSDADFDHFATHLPFSQVKEILQRSEAPLKLLLLDCCYADDSYLGRIGDPLQQEVAGVCTLVATEYRMEAVAQWRGTGYTAFAGALLEVLREGIAQGPQLLTIHDVFKALEAKLRRHGMPQPGMRGSDSAGAMPLFRNRHAEAGKEPALPPRRPDSVSAEPAAYAKDVADLAAQPGEAAESRRRLGTFVQRRELPDVAALVRAFLALDRAELAAAVVGSACTLRDEAEFATLAHLLHDGAVGGHDDVPAGQPSGRF